MTPDQARAVLAEAEEGGSIHCELFRFGVWGSL